MVIEKILCDRCKGEVNGGGYSISYELLDDRFRMAVTSKLNETGDSHVCGRHCLMLMLNDFIDRISKKIGGQ